MGFRLNLEEKHEKKLEEFEKKLSSKGVKNFDKSEVINKALSRLKPTFWKELEEEYEDIDWLFKLVKDDENNHPDIIKFLRTMKKKSKVKSVSSRSE